MTAVWPPPAALQPAAPALCRNCGAAAPGAYCPNCGQETSLALPTVRAMLHEAAGRYVAFDGRMWRTLFALFFRPGFLTREYFAGRRRRYIRPARLFLVLSIGLFALLRFAGEPPSFADVSPAEGEKGARADSDKASTSLSKLHVDFVPDAWLDPLRRRAEQFNRLPRQEQAEQISAGMLRYGPYAMFVLLPLFALLLQLVYFGRARRLPTRPQRYAAHLVFGAHNHAFLFLVGALYVLLPRGLLRDALVIWAIANLLLSMRAVYGGRWFGVFARAAAIFLVYAVCFGFVVAGLVVTAILLR